MGNEAEANSSGNVGKNAKSGPEENPEGIDVPQMDRLDKVDQWVRRSDFKIQAQGGRGEVDGGSGGPRAAERKRHFDLKKSGDEKPDYSLPNSSAGLCSSLQLKPEKIEEMERMRNIKDGHKEASKKPGVFYAVFRQYVRFKKEEEKAKEKQAKNNPPEKRKTSGLSKEVVSKEIGDSPMQTKLGEVSDPHDRKREGFWPVGLKNVGQSCWFSASIQPLFHIPAFRAMIINEDSNEMELSELEFMKELRRLFALLVASNRKYVDPSKVVDILRGSIGGGGPTGSSNGSTVGSNDSYQQDINECIHIILEWVGKSNEDNPIENMFHGKVMTRGKTRGIPFSMEEPFESLLLEVQSVTNLNEALEKFTVGGAADDSGQERWFTQLPPILWMELKRYKFNPELKMTEKVNSSFEFPEIIFMDRYTISPSNDMTRLPLPEELQHTRTSSRKQEREETKTRLESSLKLNKRLTEDELHKLEFHLHAVMVHQGSINSGHYWAYIRDHKNMVWHKFNDTSITEVTWEEIQRESVGGHSNASAYALVYIDASKPELLEDDSDPDILLNLPQDLIDYVRKDNQLFRKEMIDWAPKKRMKQLTDPENDLEDAADDDEDLRFVRVADGKKKKKGEDDAGTYKQRYNPPPDKPSREQPEWLPEGLALHPYQIDGLNWACHSWKRSTNIILADEMGIDHKIQAITFLYSLYIEGHCLGPFLILVPKDSFLNWKKKLEKWAPEFYVVYYNGDKESQKLIRDYDFEENQARKGAKASRIRASTVKFHVLLASELGSSFLSVDWKILVVDQAHRVHKSKFDQIPNYRIKFKMIMTGTPIQNNLEESFFLLKFLAPTKLNDLESFQTNFSDIAEEEQVNKLQRLLGPVMLRRMKADVLSYAVEDADCDNDDEPCQQENSISMPSDDDQPLAFVRKQSKKSKIDRLRQTKAAGHSIPERKKAKIFLKPVVKVEKVVQVSPQLGSSGSRKPATPGKKLSPASFPVCIGTVPEAPDLFLERGHICFVPFTGKDTGLCGPKWSQPPTRPKRSRSPV